MRMLNSDDWKMIWNSWGEFMEDPVSIQNLHSYDQLPSMADHIASIYEFTGGRWKAERQGDYALLAMGPLSSSEPEINDTEYEILISYRNGFLPQAIVLSPQIRNGVPFVYRDGTLNIIEADGVFDPSTLLGHTFLPMIVEWLDFYGRYTESTPHQCRRGRGFE